MMEKKMIGGVDMWGNMMATQILIDAKIQRERDLDLGNYPDERILAVIVEICEMVNEIRCFKIWSDKPESDRGTILEEFVDGIHFFASLAAEHHLDPRDMVEACEIAKRERLVGKTKDKELRDRAISTHIRRSINWIVGSYRRESFIKSFSNFMAAGYIFGFEDNEIERAFYIKSQKNSERSDHNY